ncbi:MAG: ROK family protein [Acidobacteriota bacterium]|nr:ROK family protein [Acidobacteriota bacterium]
MQSSGAVSRRGVLAVDIGGTKIRVAVVGDDGTVEWSEQRPTPATTEPSHDQAEAVWSVVSALVDTGLGRGPVEAVGVGCGGPTEGGNETVSPLNIRAWRRFPLRARLSQLTGLAVKVDNDAKALALAEGRWGGASGVANYMSMVVSTGVGGGLVVDGRLLDGRTANAGHVGHVVVLPGGRRCACGGAGCLEAEASGTAIAAITGRPAAQAPPEVVERTGRLVGRAVGSVANLVDFDLTTVSGSVALGFGEPFFVAAQKELSATARLAFSAGCRIEPSRLGPDGPILGAAAVGMSA